MNRRMTGRLAACALLGATPLSTAVANEQSLALDEQIVTASRVAQTAEQSLAAVTVLDRAAIERSQAKSLQELLARTPGVAMANNGGPGKNSSIYLRGTSSSHVLVLVDGMQVGSATLGSTAFQDLPLELIERIEVVRGPRSSLYGSEAIGGVIQIFTRNARAQGIKPFFSAGYGTHDSYEATAGVNGGSQRGWYSLALNGSDTDGIDSTLDNENDSDGYRRLAGSLRAGYRFDNGLELDGSYLQADGHNDYDGRYQDWWTGQVVGRNAYAEVQQRVLGARARFSPVEPLDVTLRVSRSEDKSDDYQDGAFNSRFDTRRDGASWQNDLTLADGQTLTLGLDYQRDEVNGTTDYDIDNRENEGVFAQYLATFGRHDLQLSARHDENEQFGSHKTGSIAWGYALTDALRLTASYGSAFKAPTFNDLYYPGFGNPDLQPEKSRSLELGLAGKHGWGHWSANLFRTEVEDLITTVCDAFWVCTAEGADDARLRGLELVLGSSLGGWQWNANYTLLDAENRSRRDNDRYYGNDLNNRPSQVFNLDLDRQFGALGVGATLHALDSSYADLDNAREIAGFATLDLRGEYRLTPEWRVQTRLANLLGADYQTSEGYNQPGQAVYVSVRYQAL